MKAKDDRARSLLALTAAMVIMGTIGVFRRMIPLSSAALALARGVVGGGALALFMALRRRRWPRIGWRAGGMMALAGAMIGVNWMLLFEAYNDTTVPRATLVYYLQPTIVLLLSPLVFGERLTAKKLACAGAALVGMALVSGVLEGGLALSSREPRGLLMALGAAMCYALVVILNKKLGETDVYARTVIEMLAAAAVMLPYTLAMGAGGAALTGGTLALLILVGAVHTGLTYALWFAGMRGLPAQTVSALSYIDPVTAMLVSALFLGERLTPLGLLGAALILGAAFIGENGPDRK